MNVTDLERRLAAVTGGALLDQCGVNPALYAEFRAAAVAVREAVAAHEAARTRFQAAIAALAADAAAVK